MDRAFEYAAVMTAHGLTVWDPQADAIVGGDDDSARVAENRFAATSELVGNMAHDDDSGRRTSRWTFWKR
jgi:hypothetical protein